MATLSLHTPPEDSARLPSAVLALSVHLLLFIVLFFGVRWSSKVPDAVVVELWSSPPVPEPLPPKAVAPEPKPEPRPKPVPKPEPKPAPVKKPDIAVEKEKKPPPKPKPEPKLDLDLRDRIKEQLAREAQALAQRPRSEVQKPAAPQPPSAPVMDSGYANRIRSKIRGNIVVPPDIQGDPEAIFDVVQLPTGEVLSVRLRKSSGHKAYDEAIERAILKSSPLPRPDKPDQFQRQLELKFRPKESV